jgi:hypothetical protein
MIKSAVIAVALAAGIACAPPAQAYSGDQASAEEAVAAIYSQVQRRCTPGTAPSLQSISWSQFSPQSFGEGRIIDASAGLGGPFQVAYHDPSVGPAKDAGAFRGYGQWGVNLEFC